VYHDFHWLLVSTKLLTARLYSPDIKESESEILERSDILPPTPQPWLYVWYLVCAFHRVMSAIIRYLEVYFWTEISFEKSIYKGYHSTGFKYQLTRGRVFCASTSVLDSRVVLTKTLEYGAVAFLSGARCKEICGTVSLTSCLETWEMNRSWERCNYSRFRSSQLTFMDIQVRAHSSTGNLCITLNNNPAWALLCVCELAHRFSVLKCSCIHFVLAFTLDYLCNDVNNDGKATSTFIAFSSYRKNPVFDRCIF